MLKEIKEIFKEYIMQEKKIAIKIETQNDLGTITYYKYYPFTNERQNTIFIPNWDKDNPDISVSVNDNQINFDDKNVSAFKKPVNIEHDDKISFCDMINYDYSDITDEELLRDPEDSFSKTRLRDREEGLWVGIGTRKIKVTFDNSINWNDLKKISFKWTNWNGNETFSSKKMTAWRDNVEIFNKSEGILLVDTDMIYYEFFDSGKSELKKARFTGELRLILENANWEEEIILPIEISFKIPQPETDFVSIDFGTSSTCIAIKKGAVAKPLSVDFIGESKDDFESPTALMIFNWDEIYQKWIKLNEKPHLIMGVADKTDSGDFTYGNFVKDYLKNQVIEFKELEAILTDLKSLPYLESLKKLDNYDFRSIRSEDRSRPEIKLVCDPEEQKVDNKSFDPIAFYAYILGCSINRVSKTNTYINYRLTMPVKFTEAVKEKLIKSIKYGLKKSLPLSCQDLIQVNNQCTEPVAFMGSVLDLKENDSKKALSLRENPKNLFAVYDFGGGTLDFACGLWKKIEECDIDEYPDLEYNKSVIHVFGQGGKENMGGERLISRIATKIYIENIETMAANNIPFTIDDDIDWPEKSKYPGLIINAGRPNNIMIEERIARNLFYKFDLSKSDKEKHESISYLMDIDGDIVEGIDIIFDPIPILNEIKDDIDDSVYQFKKFIENSFNINIDILYKNDIIFNFNELYIYLAGNTCNSSIVHDAFKRHFSEVYVNNNAERINFINDERHFMTPKTMVSLGQINFEINSVARKLVSKSPFRYYLLVNDSNSYKNVILPHKDYHDWVQYDKHENWGERQFYYTTHPDSENLTFGDSDVSVSRRLSMLTNKRGYLYVKPEGISQLKCCLKENRKERPTESDSYFIFDLESEDN